MVHEEYRVHEKQSLGEGMKSTEVMEVCGRGLLSTKICYFITHGKRLNNLEDTQFGSYIYHRHDLARKQGKYGRAMLNSPKPHA